MLARIPLFRVNLSTFSLTRSYKHLSNNKSCFNHMARKSISVPKCNGILLSWCRGLKQDGSVRGIKVIWNSIFGKYLLVTNIIGSGVLMVVGDIAAQEIEFRRGVNTKRYDLERIGRMFVVEALQGPLHHYVYNWMDKVMPVANLRNTVKKILIDQLFMSPACIFIFFYSACYLERKTLKETNDEIREKFLFIYVMDWMLWPGAQYVNFRYLDTKYRVTFVNICTALYNIFMSYVKHDYGH